MNQENNKSRSAFLTPTNSTQFKFPPDICSSLDRLRNITNYESIKRGTSRRSFTPIRGSFFMKSPDISPIEFYIKRAPPGKVMKAVADSTVTDSLPIAENSQFELMPPPSSSHHRRLEQRNVANIDLEVLARQRRNETYFGSVRSSVRLHSEDCGFIQRIPSKRRNGELLRKNYLNAHISLALQLQEAGLGRFIATFEKEEIDLNIFLIMTEDDLIRIGINDSGDRAALLKFRRDLF